MSNKDDLKTIHERFLEFTPTDEDIISLARKLGCLSEDVQVCKTFLKEYCYRSPPEYPLN